MAITYKLTGGVYKVSAQASLFLANQIWLAKQQYGVSPGTIIIDPNHLEYKKLGMTLGIIDFRPTPLFVSGGVLHYMGNPEPPYNSQVQIWAIELNNA